MKGWVENPQLVIDHGEGVKLYDTEGKEYLDAISSLWVNIHGHNRKEINDAIIAQLGKIEHSTLLGLINEPSAELAEKLVEVLPEGLNKVFYVDDGATAVEAALKIAFQYWQYKGKPENRRSSIWAIPTMATRLALFPSATSKCFTAPTNRFCFRRTA